MLNYKKFIFYIISFILLLSITGCSKNSSEPTYEIVNGQIVEITPDSKQSNKSDKDNTSNKKKKNKSEDSSVDNDSIYDDADIQSAKQNYEETKIEAQNNSEQVDNYIPSEYQTVGASSGSVTSEIATDTGADTTDVNSDRFKQLEKNMETAVNACSDIYNNADKGEGINISLSTSTISDIITAIGQAGLSAIDYNNDLDMQCYEQMNQFGLGVNGTTDDSGTYFVVYQDGHISGFNLYRENGKWNLISLSSDLGTFRIYQDSKGRYDVKEVKYTSKGWLIYLRDTDTKYTMIRVKPQDSYAKALCQKYVEPVGYLENNLFTTTWNQDNMGPIDFNSLYAYIFGMYNGTQMLSSYNVRSYYKSYGGTRIYIVPTETFENNTLVYFDIDSAVLKSISDFSYELGGYMFLGYNRDYYNVLPKTPSPEVVAYQTNSDGSITMTVDAVNPWYGTDVAFEHILTVMPEGNAFKYISNTLVSSENNIIPEQKLSAMLDVERAKSDY